MTTLACARRSLSILCLLGVAALGCDVGEVEPSGACFSVPTDVPRISRGGGWDANGTTLQGRTATREVPAGDRGYLGLGDLNGVRLELAHSGATVTLDDDQLVADGHADTSSLRGVALRATTSDGRAFDLRIESTTTIADSETIALVVDGVPVCAPGEDGIFVEGRWDDHGARIDEPGELTYACSSGAIAKCAAWGYAPWLADADVHLACTRMVRADYCGDGNTWTIDGTIIDAYDSIGIQSPVAGSTMQFEAAWGTAGAVCVADTRYDITDASGRTVTPPCFADLPICDGLDDATMLGAVLANSTAHEAIDACE